MEKIKLFQVVICTLGLAFVACCSGCAKETTYGAVKFVTTPGGAEVINLKDDTILGTSPAVVTWESLDGKPEYVTVEMRKTGYKEKITSLWVNMRHASREDAEAEAQEVNIDMEKR
ncbi:MAG: hypothetical protein CSA32_00260 [Desulfobulbus propionicus]|nr:MAG: hypothetical protein CSA32_00260 [Desulfobulbus propionicus]